MLLILSALGAALGTEKLCIRLVTDQALICAASLGFSPGQLGGWSALPFGPAGGPVGMAAATERPGAEPDVPATATRAGPPPPCGTPPPRAAAPSPPRPRASPPVRPLSSPPPPARVAPPR